MSNFKHNFRLYSLTALCCAVALQLIERRKINTALVEAVMLVVSRPDLEAATVGLGDDDGGIEQN